MTTISRFTTYHSNAACACVTTILLSYLRYSISRWCRNFHLKLIWLTLSLYIYTKCNLSISWRLTNPHKVYSLFLPSTIGSNLNQREKMSKRKFIGILLLMCTLAIAFADDLTSTMIGRPLRATPRLKCATKKDYDIITEFKRLPQHRYVTEYKRFPEYRYSFGIGKRWYDDTKVK